MKLKVILVCTAAIALCASTAMALDPMGPPAAGLYKGQTSMGIDYSYSDQKLWRDLFDEVHGMEQEINKVYFTLGYGLSDRTEVFARLGFSNYDYTRERYDGSPGWKGDDSCAVAMGVGIKRTFYEEENLTWGGLAQASWAKHDGTRVNVSGGGSYSVGTFDTTLIEFQLAAGPTYRWTDTISIYGGPFLHFIDGTHLHVHAGGSRKSGIEERSSLGGYVGSQFELRENCALNVEYMATPDAWAFGAGVKYRF